MIKLSMLEGVKMIDYIIIAGIVIIIVLVIIAIIKNVNEAKITERLGKLETNTIKELSNFQLELVKNMNSEFDKTNKMLEERLMLMNEKVNDRLDQNFNKTNKTFTSILERLSKIDEAQKKIDNLGADIVSLQSILTDKKTRGIFGEVNLNHILVSIFGEKNDKIYRTQYTFNNGTIADAVIFAPKPLGTIAVDSKFPLENYRQMVDKNKSKLFSRKKIQNRCKKTYRCNRRKIHNTWSNIKSSHNVSTSRSSICRNKCLSSRYSRIR